MPVIEAHEHATAPRVHAEDVMREAPGVRNTVDDDRCTGRMHAHRALDALKQFHIRGEPQIAAGNRILPLGIVEQTLTHREVRVEIQAARASGTPSSGNVRWVAPAGLSALGLSSLARKSLGRAGVLTPRRRSRTFDAGGGAE